MVGAVHLRFEGKCNEFPFGDTNLEVMVGYPGETRYMG